MDGMRLVFILFILSTVPMSAYYLSTHQASWVQGGDSYEYFHIAKNIVNGKGFTSREDIISVPQIGIAAYRNPLYPLILAFFMKVSGYQHIVWHAVVGTLCVLMSIPYTMKIAEMYAKQHIWMTTLSFSILSMTWQISGFTESLVTLLLLASLYYTINKNTVFAPQMIILLMFARTNVGIAMAIVYLITRWRQTKMVYTFAIISVAALMIHWGLIYPLNSNLMFLDDWCVLHENDAGKYDVRAQTTMTKLVVWSKHIRSFAFRAVPDNIFFLWYLILPYLVFHFRKHLIHLSVLSLIFLSYSPFYYVVRYGWLAVTLVVYLPAVYNWMKDG